MKPKRALICGIAGIILAGGRLLAEDSHPSNALVATPAVYVPDTTHASEPMATSIFAWDSISKETNAVAGAAKAYFTFSFTNVSAANVAILDVHASCSCTTAQLPSLPWIISPGSNGQFGVTVNLGGRMGTLFKPATVKTDKGSQTLMLKITILPAVIPTQSEADRAKSLELAKTDRQMIFRGDCAVCHVKPGEGKYGKPLYDAVCAVCHESQKRASMVPDLHNLKTPTNVDFWQTWIAHGKAGSLMPAFSTTDGGPLSDMQIAALAQYLAATFPSQPAINK
jgi:mono/diheme cytochrome c family protein